MSSTTEAGPLVRVRLDLSYDGSEFSGWAVQPSRRTVQGVLQEALATVLRLPSVALTVAGRTDAGVHATGQVAHCDLPVVPADLARRLSGFLPRDIVVLAATPVSPAFDARFAALWRRYEYRIATGRVAPLRRRFVLDHRRSLDVAAMADAALPLVGLHDFCAFCRRREGVTTRRTILDFTVLHGTGEGAGEIVCEIRADAFCHSMVRSLVGSLLAVGEGRRPVSWPASMLTLRARADDVSVAPARGLTLIEVAYPPDAELAERTARTRARRS